MGYVLVLKSEIYGQKYMNFKNLKNQVKVMLKGGKMMFIGLKRSIQGVLAYHGFVYRGFAHHGFFLKVLSSILQ